MNPGAVLVAPVSSFLLGGLWHSPAPFGPAWNTGNNGPAQHGHPAKVVGVSFGWRVFARSLVPGHGGKRLRRVRAVPEELKTRLG